MLRTIGFPLMCLAMFFIAGGHWAMLQTVAWAGMLTKYSQEASFGEAISKTFDGEHPCALCEKVVEARKQEEQKPPMLKVDKKTDVFVACDRDMAPRPNVSDFSYPEPGVTPVADRSDTPPSGVPRPIFA